MHLLKGVLQGSLGGLNAVTPRRLYKTLGHKGVTDLSLEADRQIAESEGYLFRSKSVDFERSFAVVKKYSDRFKDLEDYLENSKVAERAELYKAAEAQDPGNRVKIAAAYFVLESQISLLVQKKIEGKFVKELERSKKTSKDDDEAMGALKEVAKAFGSKYPWTKLKSGYGVPLAQDFAPVAAEQTQNTIDLQKTVHDWAVSKFKEEIAEIEAVQANMKYFRSEIVRK